MTRRIGLLAASAALALLPALAAEAQEPLSIAKQGYLFAGGKYTTVNGRQVLSGQMYVEYQIPRRRTQAYPIVIIPGAAQTATNFTGTETFTYTISDGRGGTSTATCRNSIANNCQQKSRPRNADGFFVGGELSLDSRSRASRID